MSDLLGMCQLATSSTGCANPTPLLRPLYPLPHHHRPPSACSRAGSSGWPARPVYALVPCCQPELPITMLDDAPPQRAVSASPRAIGRDRALACLVRAFRRGEFCSRSPDRIGVAAGPSWAGPTAPTSTATLGRAVRRRLWAACGRQRRERRSTAAEHAARGGMRRGGRGSRESCRGSQRSPGGRPLVCAMCVSPLPMSCAHVRRCLIYLWTSNSYCGRISYVESRCTRCCRSSTNVHPIALLSIL